MSRKHKKKLNYRFVCLVCFMLCIIFMIFGYIKYRSPFYTTYTIEAGSELTVDDLLKRNASSPEILTDIKKGVLDTVGTHTLKVKCDTGRYEVNLKVIDTVAPVITFKEETLCYVGDDITAASIVESAKDETTITYKFKEDYQFETGKATYVEVIATDEGGNQVEGSSTITVIEDTEAPVVNAAVGIYINISDSVAYKKYLSVTDNRDSYDQLDIKVDTSKVNIGTAGYYPLTYTVTDRAGNSTTATSKVVVKDRNDKEHKETAEKLASEFVEKFASTGSNKQEKLKLCFDELYDHFNRTSVHYGTLDAYYQDASYGFRTNSGDCLVMISMMRMICDELDIEYVPIIRTDSSNTTNHYWIIADTGDGYYHYDVYRHQGGLKIYRYTDEMLDEWNAKYNNLDAYNKNAYPARETK